MCVFLRYSYTWEISRHIDIHNRDVEMIDKYKTKIGIPSLYRAGFVEST